MIELAVAPDLAVVTANHTRDRRQTDARALEVFVAVQPVEQAVIRDQIRSSLETFPVKAIKTGMLHSRATVELVAKIGRRGVNAGQTRLAELDQCIGEEHVMDEPADIDLHPDLGESRLRAGVEVY